MDPFQAVRLGSAPTKMGQFLKDYEDETAVVPGFVRSSGEKPGNTTTLDGCTTATRTFEVETDRFYEQRARELNYSGQSLQQVEKTKLKTTQSKALYAHLSRKFPNWCWYVCDWPSHVDPKKRRLNKSNWLKLEFRKATVVESLEKIKAGYLSRWTNAVNRVYITPNTGRTGINRVDITSNTGQAAAQVTPEFRPQEAPRNDLSDLCPLVFPPQVQAVSAMVGKGRQEVLSCKTVNDFLIQRGTDKIIGFSLEVLYQSRGDQDPLDHGRNFAKNLLRNDIHARNLDEYVRVCLDYLFHLADCFSPDMATEPICEIITDIYKLCLPMKRARVLYYKHFVNCLLPGADWIAPRHVQHEYWKERIKHQITTIDERFYKFIEIPGLVGLYKHPDFTEWLEPAVCPEE